MWEECFWRRSECGKSTGGEGVSVESAGGGVSVGRVQVGEEGVWEE